MISKVYTSKDNRCQFSTEVFEKAGKVMYYVLYRENSTNSWQKTEVPKIAHSAIKAAYSTGRKLVQQELRDVIGV